MVQIKQQLTDTKNKSKGTNPCVGITIHETANTSPGAGAQAHANLQSRGNVRQASWHWQVDDKIAIQSLEHIVRAWHAGTSIGNNNYVAIEICVNPDSNYAQACKNAAELVRHIRSTGVGYELKQHNAFSGKDCPNFMREGRDGVTWAQFVAWVNGGTGSPAAPSAPAQGGFLGVKGVHTGRLTADGNFELVTDGDLGAGSISRWQQVMGTPINGKIFQYPHRSALIKADQAFLNRVVGSGHIQNLTGKPSLDEDGWDDFSDTKTSRVRQFWLRNAVNPQHQINLTGAVLEFDGYFFEKSVKVLQFALNNARAGSGEYGRV